MRLSRLTGSAIFGAAMLLAGTLAPTTVATSNVPGWYGGGHRIDAGGDLAVKILGQQASSASPVGNSSGDANGALYAAWNDRPAGVGGNNSNATRIFLSFSRDGNTTWSAPQVISGALDTRTMNDRFQPWITTDSSGVHAMWYERIHASPVDLIQTDKEDLSLATATAAPKLGRETTLSAAPFPVNQTNPQQDPVISFCYMGDYNNIFSTGTKRYVTWGDNHNVVTTSGGAENQPDVFLQAY